MTDTEFVKQAVAENAARIIRANDEIFACAELAYEEFRSMETLTGILEEEGFEIRTGIAGIPTAFTASAGSGRPVIALLGEFDALDGLSQAPGVPERRPVTENGSGHGCGHCALGTAALSAAVAVKKYLERNAAAGTVVYFGCPAEEGAGAKQFMARAGAFDDVDFAFTWHPSTVNEVTQDFSTAIMGAVFEFSGKAAHAGGSPWLGRSALDACELMNVGCNYLREHIPDGQRIHYAYANAGGTAPNVVPPFAKIKYEVRAKNVGEVKELFRRVRNVAEGAALMTETEMKCSVTMAFSDFMTNTFLGKTAAACMQELGAPDWDGDDYALAERFLLSHDEQELDAIRKEIRAMFGEDRAEAVLKRPLHAGVLPYEPWKGTSEGGSTDVGDVSYVVPTAEIHVACASLGTELHTWQMAGQAGSRIAHKGLLRAAEILALSCIRLLRDPETVAHAKAETLKRNGGAYVCPLPDSVKPPIGVY